MKQIWVYAIIGHLWLKLNVPYMDIRHDCLVFEVGGKLVVSPLEVTYHKRDGVNHVDADVGIGCGGQHKYDLLDEQGDQTVDLKDVTKSERKHCGRVVRAPPFKTTKAKAAPRHKRDVEVDLKPWLVDSPPEWRTRCYTLLDKFIKEACEEFGVTPQVDAFASESNKHFPKHWERVFDNEWDKLLLWINAPFEYNEMVVDHLIKWRSEAFVVVPVWPQFDWFHDLMDITVSYWDLPKDEPLFVNKVKKVLPQRQWTTLICYVNGSLGTPETFSLVRRVETAAYSYLKQENVGGPP